jgi:nickel transport protein
MAKSAKVFLFLWLALLPETAEAHKLKIFASLAGGEVEGKVYFVGGGSARHAAVAVETREGQKVDQLTADSEGRFTMTLRRPVDHVFIADLADGHVARFLLKVEALPKNSSSGAEAVRGVSGVPDVATAITPSPELALLVERAVARQVQPLLVQLNNYEDQLRLRDILGGLGFIIGLAGIAAWFKTPRREVSQDKDATP